MLDLLAGKGFDKGRIDLYTDYQRNKRLDINRLLRSRASYDGALIGPTAHRMCGDFGDCDSLLAALRRHSEDYIPFAVMEQQGSLKITNKTLNNVADKLLQQLRRIDQYLG